MNSADRGTPEDQLHTLVGSTRPSGPTIVDQDYIDGVVVRGTLEHEEAVLETKQKAEESELGQDH